MTAVSLEVHATDPPSMSVKVLDYELPIDLWSPLYMASVLVCIRGNQLMVLEGVPSGSPLRPALPTDAFPLAEILIPPCTESIREQNIVQLTTAYMER